MTKKQIKQRNNIIISIILFLIGLLVSFNKYLQLIFFIAAYLIVGYKTIYKAFRNIGHGQIFDENFLMTIATFGAFMVSEYPEACMVMILYQIGELFQDYAVNKSRESISSLVSIRPDVANMMIDNELVEVDAEDVHIGDKIICKPGERVPLDGVIIKGSANIDTSALTGESLPRSISEGEEILSGVVNIDGLLTIEVTKEFEESTVSKILDLVENASSKKANAENFITKFAKYYTPIVVILALMIVIVPTLLGGNFNDYLIRACMFLLISCPCALVISVPLGFFGGIGGASKSGILVKGSNYLEALAKVDTIVFDKTGTLTKGNFEVINIESDILSKEALLEVAAYIESYSDHPIALSIKKAYQKDIDTTKVSDVINFGGKGIKVKYNESIYLAGNRELMVDNNIKIKETKDVGTIIYIAKDNNYLGHITIADIIKEDTYDALKALKNRGIKTVMLTGDNERIAMDIANKLHIDNYYSSLLPNDKVNKLEELLKDNKVAFVGDGINDAPSLVRADVGIAMGALGSDAAIEASDIVIMDDNLKNIDKAIAISKKTLRIVYQNIAFSLIVKFSVLILSAFGLTNIWVAEFADVGVSFIAILNSMRALRVNKL